MLRLPNKTAMITGAGRGIGKAIAAKFLREGAHVLLCDIMRERIESTAAELAALGEVHWLAGDITSAEFCDELTAKASTVFGFVDVLVNNAGIAISEPFLQHTQKTWDRTLAVNLTSMFMLSQRVARTMVARGQGGAIVNMASTNGHLGEPNLAAYNASKGAVVLLTKTMAIELAPHNIRVNCVSPGSIETELAAEGGAAPDFHTEYIKKIPLGRNGKPEEVANVFAFLASDEASFMTGESVVVDGGQISEE